MSQFEDVSRWTSVVFIELWFGASSAQIDLRRKVLLKRQEHTNKIFIVSGK